MRSPIGLIAVRNGVLVATVGGALAACCDVIDASFKSSGWPGRFAGRVLAGGVAFDDGRDGVDGTAGGWLVAFETRVEGSTDGGEGYWRRRAEQAERRVDDLEERIAIVRDAVRSVAKDVS